MKDPIAVEGREEPDSMKLMVRDVSGACFHAPVVRRMCVKIVDEQFRDRW